MEAISSEAQPPADRRRAVRIQSPRAEPVKPRLTNRDGVPPRVAGRVDFEVVRSDSRAEFSVSMGEFSSADSEDHRTGPFGGSRFGPWKIEPSSACLTMRPRLGYAERQPAISWAQS